MLILTFKYNTCITSKDRVSPWLSKYFPSAKPLGIEKNGTGYEVEVSLQDFEKNKEKIPSANLLRVRGCFTVAEMLCLGVRDFDNDLRNKDFLRKVFPHSDL